MFGFLLSLTDVRPDGCGTVHATLAVRRRARARDVVLLLDGDEIGTVTVPSRARSVPVEVFVGAERAGELSARWRFVDTDPVPVVTPPWDAAVRATVPVEAPAGEVPPLELAVLGCDARRFTVSAEVVESGEVLAWRAPIGPIPSVQHPGTWTVRLTLADDGEPVDVREVRATVGPPCVDEDGDGHLLCRRGDCDDRDPRVHPGAEDVVGNGLDEDCDGRNGRDRDRDGFEDAAVGGDDCDDLEALVNPRAVRFPDQDGDGASVAAALDFDCDGDVDPRPGKYDCDDADPSVPREEAPVPTGVDEDCDGLVDEGTVAYDDDGDGLSEERGDCDDGDPRIHPAADETPDCRDEDCDGLVDDGVVRPAKDDRWEPNDVDAVEIPGAHWRSGFFGGSWRSSRTRLRPVTRNGEDVERFVVYAHDGDLDTFHVTVGVDALGDDRSYEVVLTTPSGRTVSGVVDHGGDEVAVGGRAGRDDSGRYTIELRPVAGELDWCPVELVVGTG